MRAYNVSTEGPFWLLMHFTLNKGEHLMQIKFLSNLIHTIYSRITPAYIKINYYILYLLLISGIIKHFTNIWFLADDHRLSAFYLLLAGWSCLLFIISTDHEQYNFRKRKLFDILLIIFCSMTALIYLLSGIFYSIFLPILFQIPISQDITSSMIVWLSRFFYSVFTLILPAMSTKKLIENLMTEESRTMIDQFKLRKYLDTRENKEFLYDLNIIKKMEDGSDYTIKEKDRQRHMILSGVTGTGKTSSAMLPAIASDLDRKAKNEDYTKTQILTRIISKNDIYIEQNFNDLEFNIHHFKSSSEEGSRFLEQLSRNAPSAGITVIAPNADLADHVYELAAARGFRVNRIDPVPLHVTTGEMKPGFKGFNPLYISPDLPESQRKLEIFRKSRMFSDVLQALYEQTAKTDAYFTSLNRNLTSMLSILVLTTYPWLHDGLQPDVTAIQEVINDFSCVKQYLYALAKIVKVGDELENPKDITPDWLKTHKFGEYQFIVSQIAYDLLGAGKIKMEDQARGLRIILNEFLTDPLVRKVLCEKDTVDIDHALSKGEITVVNYGLELGMSIATGFGLFFCLSFNQAVLRRPGNENNRLLHFYYCDEFPVLLHKDMEQIFTLFRQYKVCFTCAFQTFSQFDRNEITKFLKNVVLSNVGHHIIYGSCSIEEMEIYQKLAGKKLHFIEQETISETALSSQNTTLSFSTRTTPEYKDAIEGYKMRDKDFQEVTVFGLNNGDHVPPFDAKLSFLTPEQWKGPKRCHINWEIYQSESSNRPEFQTSLLYISRETNMVKNEHTETFSFTSENVATIISDKKTGAKESDSLNNIDFPADYDDIYEQGMHPDS